jgi:hypothetical protein
MFEFILPLIEVVAYVADMISTAQDYKRLPTSVEAGYFCKGTRNVTCIALSWGAVTVVTYAASVVLLHYGHSHHWMWAGAAAIQIIGTVGHGYFGAWRNSQLHQ